jgi:hypothetical protein
VYLSPHDALNPGLHSGVIRDRADLRIANPFRVHCWAPITVYTPAVRVLTHGYGARAERLASMLNAVAVRCDSALRKGQQQAVKADGDGERPTSLPVCRE